MKHPRFRAFLRTSLFVVILMLCFASVGNPTPPPIGDKVFHLQPPPFLSVARAETSAIGALLDQEAGISAYHKSPYAVDLNQVRGEFRTIETETADYIIGSVAVPNYPEHYDAHVYVHKDGWILAYYLRAAPVSKIVDVKGQTISSSNLTTVVAAVAGAAGAPFSEATYYDFRYPNATNLMFIAEDDDNGDDFTIQLPSSFGYFERSWAVGPYDYFYVDAVRMSSAWAGYGTSYGTLAASQLLPDTTHTIAIGYSTDYGVLVIVYRVP